MKPIIQVKDLSFNYLNMSEGHPPIIKSLSFEIYPGELVAIQGPSGSGKSTLLYILGLLTEFQSGSLKIFNQEIERLQPVQKSDLRSSKIGFIFQQFHLLPRTSVKDNILLANQFSKVPLSSDLAQKKMQELINNVGLNERESHLTNQLSGGQQQRVAICRALLNDPELILADEPTGNLDSKSALQILNLLVDLNKKNKKTVVIITHDNEVASRCDRILHIRDGAIVQDIINHSSPFTSSEISFDDSVSNLLASLAKTNQDLQKTNLTENNNKINIFSENIKSSLNLFFQQIPTAIKNLKRNKLRSFLTLLGISVGIAAVTSMITLGRYTERKILDGYAELGVNTLLFYGYPNWEQKATDKIPTQFRFFNWNKDIIPLKNVFQDITRFSPILMGWDGATSYSGKSIEQDVRIVGVSHEALQISGRKILIGRNFIEDEITNRSGVCLIGYEISERLFSNTLALGQILRATIGSNSFGCRVIGVLDSTTSNKEYLKPNLQIYVPFTFYQAQAGDWWSSQLKEIMIQTRVGSPVEKIADGIKTYFQQKYGSSGIFRVDSDSLLIAQMKKFLNLFTFLLSFIAFVTLAVGGMGITNMMLVSVAERYREIGLKKSLGASDRLIRMQFLVESIFICLMSGIIGLVFGILFYHLALFGVSKLMPKIQFQFIFDFWAIAISLISILAVGILSGIIPAIKAEKLQVIEALRSD